MDKTFCEVKLFQVKPDKLDEFEKLIAVVAKEQKQQKGCIDIKYLKKVLCI
ncbi:MAG: antibiotic biosynthesis monooxygenase [[Clostridium] scindens]